MAMDGSFKLESALERFLSRFPALQHLSQFDALVKKGSVVHEVEIVNIVAELFLNPNYTIPLLGCFRPLARKIVEKVVGLLRLVRNLSSNSNITDSEIDEEELKTVVNIIDFYDHIGRGLDLHELACLAFCRAHELAPFLLGFILKYFEFAPCPFQRIMIQGTNSAVCNEVGLLAVRLSYRLLLVEPETFSKRWDWSIFLDLVRKLSNIDQDESSVIYDIRWCGIQILSIILKFGYEVTTNLSFGHEKMLPCLLRWEEFCQDVSLEKASMYIELFEQELDSQGRTTDFVAENCLHVHGLSCPTVLLSDDDDIEPPLRSRRRLATWGAQFVGKSFVLTSSIKRSYEMVMLALSQKWPILLYGPLGAGKSALINKLANDNDNQVLFIHMDDQFDGKILLGSYVCAERPGEFKWQPGSLLQAVQNGLWVVFEDVDKAPSDVQSILLPLLEGANKFATGHGEEIRVAENFRLFATISTSRAGQFWDKEGGCTHGMLWRKVMIGPPSNDDLLNIVKAQYPILEPIASKLVETLERVNFHTQQLLGFRCGDSTSISHPNRFSLRDLLKWCKRIAGLGFSFTGDGFSDYQFQCIHQEAVDIFAAFSTSVENRLSIMKELARFWLCVVAGSIPESLYPHNKPMIQESDIELSVGRVNLQRVQSTLNHKMKPFVEIRSSLHVLERIACSVKYSEPVLLVGETGTGKTTLVQSLARRIGHKLTVLNLSQQSDVADLLGGFKPIDVKFTCFSLYKEFLDLFSKTVSLEKNWRFVDCLHKHFGDKNWKMLLAGFKKGVEVFGKLVDVRQPSSDNKRKKPEEDIKAWEKFGVKLEAARGQIDASSGMIFSFVEGAFVTAIRNGEWILLDEINLAPPETLQRVIGVLEGDNGSLCLAERGDINYICRHPNFRIFACMNPATDAGKRDLPVSLRSRFTEFFVDDVLDADDLTLFVNQFMDDSQANRELVNGIVSFYKAAKKVSEERLQDGANQKPQYSLRSLYRALEYTRKAERRFGFFRALYDGFCMFFLTMLDGPSSQIMKHMILSHLLDGRSPPYVAFDAYLSSKDDIHPDFPKNYVLTKSVREHLRNLARAVLIKRYPVLLQGPTSSGKTSLVKYLAAITGHKFVRINNHEHTDLQEYLGSYITDSSGNLVFQEGMLVEAVRNGYWIVLDELNLAPSDVLEALNRLLDDNRELFVPELRETVQAHPNFMLFATQNPPTFYGGRKMLSRAFRNRFVEIHVDEIPEDELITIVSDGCAISPTHAKKMVDVMNELQLRRQSSKIFSGKHGFITPRDLFRWAYRFNGSSYEDLARAGYYILAERLRNEAEKSVVQNVLETTLRVKLVLDDLYNQESNGAKFSFEMRDDVVISRSLPNITLTKSMQRLCFLVERCYINGINGRNSEPVLLVGETGGGKTTICQLLSAHLNKKLYILNCHQYTETSDFIGGFYPNRERSRLTLQFEKEVQELASMTSVYHPETSFSSDIGQATLTLDSLDRIIKVLGEGGRNCHDLCIEGLQHKKEKLSELHRQWQTIFTWQDGPLVQAMRDGDMFLIDEISLADDSVLERLNSVLEPERKLSLAEKGGQFLETITAHPEFFLFATMNPGGDYGKKELSPALRNRFTEIWVPPVWEMDELRSIALTRISHPRVTPFVDLILSFWEWFNQLQSGRVLTVRDLLSWVAFIDKTEGKLGLGYAFLHGAFLVLLDGLSLGTGMSKSDAEELRERCFSFLLEKLKLHDTKLENSRLEILQSYGWGEFSTIADISSSDYLKDNNFGIDPFYIEKGCLPCDTGRYELLAPTTYKNALRVLRAMQLSKPVLLEGSPGVGKTSLIVALGHFSGHKVVRINLSEQTDMMDLLGSDLPVESDEGVKFAWSDGILLQALKDDCWVLLDELNLAPQSVLEGLNAILDHRAEVFIPELGLTVKCHPSFRVFACQNPSYQGGGRKGLPKSFLNRFTKVYLDELIKEDYLFICSSLYESIPRPLLSNLIDFNKRLHEETMLHQKFAQDGSPWEFNLRDVLRSCQIIKGAHKTSRNYCFLDIVYIQRMRTADDRKEVLRLYEQVFDIKPYINPYPRVQINSQCLVVGNVAIKRNNIQECNISSSHLKILPGIRQSLEAVAHCIHHQWMCIVVGPSSSGKTSLIRLLAQLTGNVLNEMNLSSTTDISELLGCFEQYDAIRNFQNVVDLVDNHVKKYFTLEMKSPKKEIDREVNGLMSKWLSFPSRIGIQLATSSACVYMKNWPKIVCNLDFLIDIIKELMSYFQDGLAKKELERSLKAVLKLKEIDKKQQFSAKFEWVSGILVKAIERGEWIVLKNANLCNPTVLDRINSLVESCGSIIINECGSVDGEPVVFHPHVNFRIFLTVNPIYGEVSRAMRNRGVEIFMMQPYWLQDGAESDKKDIELNDAQRFLALAGIPSVKLVESMADAHVYARDKGFHLNVRITYIELARWVQQFQQLIMNGCKPLWSLHISWEHTYLSSLNDAEGMDIVQNAKNLYLSNSALTSSKTSNSALSSSKTSILSSLCMPGGWPMPLKLRDYVWHSKEACVKQNCMYLGYQGAQCALYELGVARKRSSLDVKFTTGGYAHTYLIDLTMLDRLLFPKASSNMILSSQVRDDFNLELASKKLFFSANWAIDQASEIDIELYIIWFSWFSSTLQPFCQSLNLYLTSIKQVMEHRVWNYICDLRNKIKSSYGIDLDMHPIPILSSELITLTGEVDLTNFNASKEKSEWSKDQFNLLFIARAIKCAGLLRLTYQQWNAESRHELSGEALGFLPILKSLRKLEQEFFCKLIDPSCNLIEDESTSFNMLIASYNTLLDDHTLLWDGLISSKFEQLRVSVLFLIKEVLPFMVFFPEAVEVVLRESKQLERISSWSFHVEKPLLWRYGGHPVLPSSSDLYKKRQQLFSLCECLWPLKLKLRDRVSAVAGKDLLIEGITSSNPDLRCLAMEGLSMSSCILGKFDEDEAIAKNLQDIYQMLLKRFEHEKNNVKVILGSEDKLVREEKSFACCLSGYDVFTGLTRDVWLDTFPLNDSTSFFLDMLILQDLSSVLLINPEKLKQERGKHFIEKFSNLMKEALQFSLKFSSRPPQMFIGHQNILWMLDGSNSVDTVRAKGASFFLEMWFRWHQSLWIHSPDFVKDLSKVVDRGNSTPHLLLQPVISATVFQILWYPAAIRDFFVQRLKIQVAACYLWHRPLHATDPHTFLLSAACNLFQQIIYAHEKSFDKDQFVEIKSLLSSFHKDKNAECIQLLCLLISKSRHQGLKNSVHLFIELLLKDLFSHDSQYKLGRVWLRLGGLRFYLLLSSCDLDPSIKYYYKYSQLVEKKDSLEVEIQVRKECELLAGLFSVAGEADKERLRVLEDLELKHRKLQKRVVFRVEPEKFKKLKHECDEFFKLVNILLTNIEASNFHLKQNIEASDSHRIVENWPETATRFIDGLSDEYAGYIDIVQPIQLAVYEIKLGLSLVLSSMCIPGADKQHNEELVMKTIYSFMRFPQGLPSIKTSVGLSNGLAWFSFSNKSAMADFYATNDGLLEKLVIHSSKTVDSDMACTAQLKSALHCNILVRASHFVADSKLMDTASFVLFDHIFSEFANLWMNMKVQSKSKEDHDSQLYKFRPRLFKIEKVIDADSDKSLDNENSSEVELLSEDESTEMNETRKEHETSEDEWSLLDESMIDQMIDIHNQLFGSSDLVLAPGTSEISDASRLLAFSGSYNLGVGLIKDFGGLLLSSLDAKLAPEHLLRLCLEHEGKPVLSERAACKYNFYKNSNPSMIAKMVNLLAPLHQRVSSLLLDRGEHHILQQIINIIEMLHNFSLDAPVAKALAGLQILVNKVQSLQEHGLKLTFPEHLEPILSLVSSWKKIEFDSWPALLDEVLDQYELNCGKLWFPLFSILQNWHSDSTSHLEDFIQTSSIGEFRKRLQLLFSFLGQFNTGACIKIYSRSSKMEIVRVLYNLVGYYMQFLPIILEHIEGCRKKTDKELKELQKLCRWERAENCLSIENSRRIRLKLRKLIKKYSDVLQQPVLLFLNQDTATKGVRVQSLQVGAEDRFNWFTDWRRGVHTVLQNLCQNETPKFGLLFSSSTIAEDLTSIIRQTKSQFPSISYQEEWKSLCCTVERIYESAIYCADIWKEAKKSQGKRRALTELLKLLETGGLSKHKSIYLEDRPKSWWFLDQSDGIQYLLLAGSRLPTGASDGAPACKGQNFENEWLVAERKEASEQYFRSVKSVMLLQQICLNSHKDITREQVERSYSFLNQLIEIQQKQYTAANHFAMNLSNFKSYVSLFGKLYSSSMGSDTGASYEIRISCCQDIIYKCMWQQKQIFDSLSTMAYEELVLLKTFKSVHLKTCGSVKADENLILEAIEKYLPVFQKSKESLDDCLLGQKEVITTVTGVLHPFIVTEQMKELVFQNFEAINNFREYHSALCKRMVNRSLVEDILLSHFEEVFEKSSFVEKEFKFGLEAENGLIDDEEVSELYSRYDQALESTFKHIINALKFFNPPCSEHNLPTKLIGNLTSWEFLSDLFMKNLSLDTLCDKLLKTISCADKLLNHSGEKLEDNVDHRLSFQVGDQFKQLHVLLDLIMNFGEYLLKDVFAFNCSVSVMTNELATVLANLYSEGFGVSTENQDDSVDDNRAQDVSGTGMGEGVGLNDVSDQIMDEDQLLGANEKASESDPPTEIPSKNDKGIEMEQDFDAETFSVSEDSGEEEEDNEDGGDEQLESRMGETGDKNEVVDEKLWNKDEDECPNNENEKYDSGPSVRNEDPSAGELRANDEQFAVADENGETDNDEHKEQNYDDESHNDPVDGEDAEDINFDKEFSEPSELKPEGSNEYSDREMDEKDDPSPMEDDLEEHGNSNEDGNIEEHETHPVDENMAEAEAERETSEMDVEGGDNEADNQLNSMGPRNDVSKPGDNVQNAEPATQPSGGLQVSDSQNIDLETSGSRSDEVQNDVASSRSLPSGDANENDILARDSSSGGRFTDDILNTQLYQHESFIHKMQPNPYRNVGDALNEWKERARVSADLQSNNTDAQEDMEDRDADEYGYVSELEKGSAQALGPATSEQIDKNANGNSFDEDSVATMECDDSKEMESEGEKIETHPLGHRTSSHISTVEDPINISSLENSIKEESHEFHDIEDGNSKNLLDNLVSVNKTYLNEPIHRYGDLSASNDDLGKAKNIEVVSNEVKDNATTLWKKYELRTTRLSQELAEQLRLVMEPTLASKLQGDYKTGKRINMKKVIPYIASHYRKDKIWMRRTRPNKRDYQIVIAVDDSRSMSESCCGDVAIEALVTVCRSMSQLEMGSLAVASFGKKGNIKLLHDFDQPFTGEAGVQMISNLTFKQENSITDEPVFDLLKYLNDMLDTAVTRARLPSGHSPLQQLVLIIADGQFHEKENLKHYVRDLLSRKRMVAFLLLDSHQESILDLMEASFEGGNIKFTKYLDSFPFPYYIILKNIEALPRTLGDLLRQWFELMQNSGD